MADQFSKMYDVERVGGDQRTRLAEMLRAAGQNQPQGQMVSGWYVPPSMTQNLNQLAQTALGTYMGASLDEEKKQKMADFLKRYEQGAEVKQEPVMQNFNGLDQRAEGQTPIPQKAPQNELERLTQRRTSTEQSQATPAMMPQQNQQYRPWTRQEKESMLMEAYGVDPRMAGLLSERMTRDFSREDEAARIASEREWREKQSEIEDKRHKENIRLTASLSAGNRVPASEKPLTEYQGQSVLYGTRAAQSNKVLENVNANPAEVEASRRGGMIGNWLSPANVQQTVQAQRDFINAVLRRESGATISPSEFENAQKQYFPQPGDKPEVLAQKKANRDLVIKGFATQAGPAGKGQVMEVYNAPYVSLAEQQPQQTAPRGRLGGQSTTPPNSQIKFLGYEQTPGK